MDQWGFESLLPRNYNIFELAIVIKSSIPGSSPGAPANNKGRNEMYLSSHLRMMIPSDRIYEISVREPKTLNQKVLKLMEEAGEVAEAVLSMDGASGSGYKQKGHEDLLEELVDVVIVCVSCMEQLGAEPHEVYEVFDEKLKKWKEKIGK